MARVDAVRRLTVYGVLLGVGALESGACVIVGLGGEPERHGLTVHGVLRRRDGGACHGNGGQHTISSKLHASGRL